jgi:TetR/AcrR family transcriptional regulator
MASDRRIGDVQSKTRAQLLDAAELVMVEEGYAAVTSRRLAAKAGLKPQLVHYYFQTMDDMFISLFRRTAGRHIANLEAALATERPLSALWELTSDPIGTSLSIEFMALANHRKTIGAEISRIAARVRTLQTEALTKAMARAGLDLKQYPPIAVAVVMAALSRAMVMEGTINFFDGHGEAVALAKRWIAWLEQEAAPAASASPKRPFPA